MSWEMVTLRKQITRALEARGETWDDIEKLVLDTTCRNDYFHGDNFDNECDCVRDLDTEYDCGYGAVNSPPFTAWTSDWVYFPAEYDGAERAESVPRNPCDLTTEHI